MSLSWTEHHGGKEWQKKAVHPGQLEAENKSTEEGAGDRI